MISPEALCDHLRETFPTAHIEAYDKTGMQDHYIIYMRDASFQGKATLARHRSVQQALAPLMASGALHAAEIKADVPTVV
jgi:stress-induced morphogen